MGNDDSTFDDSTFDDRTHGPRSSATTSGTVAVAVRGLRVERPAGGALDAGPTTVLDDITFDVHQGEVVAVLGRRGAGVSTLLAAVTGRLVPTAGHVLLWGHDPVREPDVVHPLVAALPGRAGLFAHLSVRETLQLWGDLHPTPRDVGAVLAGADLEGLADRRVRGLDTAAVQRLLVAVAFVAGTPAVVCDEPSGGVEPGTAAAVAALTAAAVADGTTVVLASSDPGDVAPHLDRVALLRRGRLVTVAGPREVVARYSPHGAATVLLGDPVEATALSSAAPGATFQRVPGGTLVEVPDCAPTQLASLTGRLRSVVRVRHHTGTLTDAVRRATADRRPVPGSEGES